MRCRDAVKIRRSAIDEKLKDYGYRYGVGKCYLISYVNSLLGDVTRGNFSERTTVPGIRKALEGMLLLHNKPAKRSKFHADLDVIADLIYERLELAVSSKVDVDEDAIKKVMEIQKSTNTEVVDVLLEGENPDLYFFGHVNYKGCLISMEIIKDSVDGPIGATIRCYDELGDAEGLVEYIDIFEKELIRFSFKGEQYDMSDDIPEEYPVTKSKLSPEEISDLVYTVFYSYLRLITRNEIPLNEMVYDMDIDFPNFQNKNLSIDKDCNMTFVGRVAA